MQFIPARIYPSAPVMHFSIDDGLELIPNDVRNLSVSMPEVKLRSRDTVVPRPGSANVVVY
eukprot:4467866-Pyramimonas_sp.AAC.1